jgi:hypothetical protein
MNDADRLEDRSSRGQPAELAVARMSMASLKPKGACWYCNQPLDNVRRFCSKTCADDYRTEEEAFSNEPK